MSTAAKSTSTTVSTSPATPKPVVRKKGYEIGTTSISQALAGNFVEEKLDVIKTPEKYAQETNRIDQIFNQTDLQNIWPKFAQKFVDQVHLFNTLSINPELLENNIVKIVVENSVQQDQIRSLKPEIIGFLRRGLNNSTIDVSVELIRSNIENKILTDEQKMKAMMQKNPALQLFKNKFNLDFNS